MSDTCEVISEERLRDLLCNVRDTFALRSTVYGTVEDLADLESLLDAINGESVGTTIEKLTYIEGTKQAIGTAIKAKGQKVSTKDTFRSYADKVLAISGGGESPGGDSGGYQLLEIDTVAPPLLLSQCIEFVPGDYSQIDMLSVCQPLAFPIILSSFEEVT